MFCAWRGSAAAWARSASEIAAAITTAASAVCGRSCSSVLKNSSSSATIPAPTSPVSWLFAPDCSATAVREPLVDTANPWKKPAAMFAVPMPIISWFGSTSSPRRAAKLVDVAMVSVSDTNVMPIAATSIGPTSPQSVQGKRRPGKPLGEGTHGVDVEVEQCRDDGGPDDRDQHGWDLLGEAGQDQQDRQRGETEHERRRVAPVEALEELLDLVDEAVGIGREAAELRELPDDDRDRQPVHVADLHLLGEQVGDEAELPDTQPDQDQTDEHGHHPGERDRLPRIVGDDDQRCDGGEDQRRHRGVRSEHQHPRRAHERVADEARDRGVQPGDGWQAGQLGIGHALRDEDRGQHDAGDHILAEPCLLVGVQRTDTRHHCGDAAHDACTTCS